MPSPVISAISPGGHWTTQVLVVESLNFEFEHWVTHCPETVELF